MTESVEQVVDRFPRRCPYCEEILPKPTLPDQETRELRETCPFCERVFVRVHIPWDELVGDD
ncbi:MAG: hypothetical protein GWP10_12590 [Nitrospiraceae bacterium]|nr:hypothetical protein [Nitrospiraceae bacterium]